MAWLGAWWFTRQPSPIAQLPSPAPPPIVQPTTAVPSGNGQVDPALAGTFAFEVTVGGLPTRFVDTLSLNGTFQMDITQTETDRYQAANGLYTTVADGTGWTETSRYAVIGAAELEVSTSNVGS